MDPDGVVGVLAGLDDLGPEFERVVSETEAFTVEGGSVFAVGGRRAFVDAWEVFMSERRVLPGAVMYAVSRAAGAVGDATLAVVTGSEDMAADTAAAQRRAEDVWGIAPAVAYGESYWGGERW